MGSALTRRRFVAGPRSTNQTCCWFPTPTPPSGWILFPTSRHFVRWQRRTSSFRARALRSEISLTLAKCGITVECHHHEVATAGQCEIDFRYSTLLGTADNLQIFKYVVKNTAFEHGKTATFMPKPLFGDNGSGMHCHQSLWKGTKPRFAGDGYSGLSKTALP